MAIRSHPRRQIVVIGAGVIGLTTALTLQEAGYQVHILADDFPAPFETIDPRRQINYASPWAGALNSWGTDLPRPDDPPQAWRDHGFALKTYAKMHRVYEQYPHAGVMFTKGVRFYEERPDQLEDLDAKTARELGIEDFALLERHDLPEGITFGYSFRTWCVNPMVYCSFLLRQFCLAGGRTRQQHVPAVEEIFAMAEFKNVLVVVNASGVGFGDPNVFIIRGQTCLVANDCDIAIMRRNKDGSSTACIPRKYSGGTIIGITFKPNKWDTEPTPS